MLLATSGSQPSIPLTDNRDRYRDARRQDDATAQRSQSWPRGGSRRGVRLTDDRDRWLDARRHDDTTPLRFHGDADVMGSRRGIRLTDNRDRVATHDGRTTRRRNALMLMATCGS